MRRIALALALCAALPLAGCGDGRDPTFHRLVQFSAVTKLQVANGKVYFTESSGFERVPIAGGTVEVVVTGTTLNDFAVYKGNGYVATGSGVLALDLDAAPGTSPRTLSSDIALAIAADENGVAWLSCDAVVVAQSDGSGQIRVPLDPLTCSPAGARIALDSSTAYGLDNTGLWYVSRSGGAITRITGASCERMVAGGGWLYCAGMLGVVRIDPLVGDYQNVVNNPVRDFALSTTSLYGADATNLFSQPRSGAGGEDVLGAYADISSVTVDDTSCYFVNTSGNLGLLLSTAL